ncbi:MAG: four helix bundle protein, partial [Planctomycetota bacterium]|nr:four helix bundle protein [Planctomycetota bacterium]
ERYSDLDFSHFLNISLTSLTESVACFDLALNDQYVTQQDFDNIIKEGEKLGKQLKAFSSYVRPDKKRAKY